MVLKTHLEPFREPFLLFTEEFTYLGSMVRIDGGAEKDITNRLNKARIAFSMLSNVWRSQQYRVKTKLKIYQSCVLSTLLYGSECWRMTKKDLQKLSGHTKIFKTHTPYILGPTQYPMKSCMRHAIRRVWKI